MARGRTLPSAADPVNVTNVNGITVEDLKAVAEDAIRGALSRIAQGGAQDLESYAKAIASDLAGAAGRGEQEASQELLGQLKMLAETQRIRVQEEGWAMFDEAVSVAMSFLVLIARRGLMA